ncbi:MAG: hypothetical protein WBC40_10235 [Halobacteriota archaeon]
MEERIKKMEVAMEQLKEMGDGIDEERIKNFADTLQELKEQCTVEVARRQNLEDAIDKLTETETQSENPLIHNPAVSESELSGIGFGAGTGVGVGVENENEIVDTVTLAQLMQWADSALNLIGMAKLNQIVELYELTGRISTEMKDTILKVAELPDTVLSPEKDHIETKHCVTSLCELDRILTGEHQELFVLLKELSTNHDFLKKHNVKHSQIQTKPQSPGPRKTGKEKIKVKPKAKKNG